VPACAPGRPAAAEGRGRAAADRVQTEHALESLDQRCGRRIELAFVVVLGMARRGDGCGPDRRQESAVDLAVGGERQAVDLLQCPREHVGRQVVGKVCQQVRGARRAPGRARPVGGDTLPVARFGGRHDARGDRVVRVQHGGDLLEFDPEPADFHLVVAAAQVLQRAVGEIAPEVPGAVHAPARPRGERVRQERGSSGRRHPRVAVGQAWSGNVDLPDAADRHAPQFGVEHVDPAVSDGGSDRHPGGPASRIVAEFVCGRDMGLRRSVFVEDTAAREPCEELAQVGGGDELLRAGDHGRQPARGKLLGVRARDRFLERRRGHEQPVDPLLVDEAHDRVDGVALLLVDQHQGPARPQGGEDLLHRDVEAQRCELQGAAVGGDPVVERQLPADDVPGRPM